MALLQPLIERAAVGMIVDRPAIEGQHTVAGALRRIEHPTAGVKDLQDRFCVLQIGRASCRERV